MEKTYWMIEKQDEPQWLVLDVDKPRWVDSADALRFEDRESARMLLVYLRRHCRDGIQIVTELMDASVTDHIDCEVPSGLDTYSPHQIVHTNPVPKSPPPTSR